LVIVSLFAAAALQWAVAVEPQHVQDFRAKVLFNRVQEVVSYRQQALSSCSKRSPLRSTANLSAEMWAAVHREPSKENLFELMRLYQKSSQWGFATYCDEEVQSFDAKLYAVERKKFIRIGSVAKFWLCSGLTSSVCEKQIDLLREQLDPHCATRVIREENMGLETNPCFAGDKLVAQVLWGRGIALRDDLKASIDTYLLAFYHGVEGAKPKDSLDYLNYAPATVDPLSFLALLTLLHASSTSNSGYVDGFGDFIWMSVLNSGESPELAVELYDALKRRRDLFRDILTWAAAKSLRLTMLGRNNVTTADRHDFVSAFLGCYFEKAHDHLGAVWIPWILGHGYEAFDFVSHRRAGTSFKRSIENFEIDTRRYVEGAAWGSDWCRGS
jgi:hypothetical protein